MMTELDNDVLKTLLRRCKCAGTFDQRLIPYISEATVLAYREAYPFNKEPDDAVLNSTCLKLTKSVVWSLFNEEIHRDAMAYLIGSARNQLMWMSSINSFQTQGRVLRSSKNKLAVNIADVPFIWYTKNKPAEMTVFTKLKSRPDTGKFKFTIAKEFDII